MSSISLVSLIFSLRVVREMAAQRTEIAAGVVNAISGISTRGLQILPE
jgi:hypothetical protein